MDVAFVHQILYYFIPISQIYIEPQFYPNLIVELIVSFFTIFSEKKN